MGPARADQDISVIKRFRLTNGFQLYIEKGLQILIWSPLNKTGNFLLSHSLATAVPSTSQGLTSVFGMGTGVALAV